MFEIYIKRIITAAENSMETAGKILNSKGTYGIISYLFQVGIENNTLNLVQQISE